MDQLHGRKNLACFMSVEMYNRLVQVPVTNYTVLIVFFLKTGVQGQNMYPNGIVWFIFFI